MVVGDGYLHPSFQCQPGRSIHAAFTEARLPRHRFVLICAAGIASPFPKAIKRGQRCYY
jgi:hypothetical protein